ncbi:zinc/manganese transport system permease protein [Actinokineospora alba]|uniref:Zinc/manganese transport system permease protein n=1 Tax=Actinokineospora alba TaxID=504798 RepID=A0A1H0STB2_9PSEU|nr:metal ABC transporter permease [Actinokineospora alba]TDP66546.1 zinc/manganese transport system permease protein [Actinokineospora alba]SDJ37443.1 zinc/manganese transport system permease protein [Actinokineospora alba]SDP45027.1 zinc/manganese transport system permease protein [Actinokineospora alba]
MDKFFDFGLTAELLRYDFVVAALFAALVLGLLAGVLGPLIVSRNMAFSVHGTSELALTGGAAALLLGWDTGGGALAGAIVAALVLGLLSRRSSDYDSVIGVVLAFGLGLGVLMLWLYKGRSSNKFGLLTGQIVGQDFASLTLLIGCAVGVFAVLAVIYRPLLFASVDPAVAQARGVPTTMLALVFAVLVGVATALGVRTVGSLLVLALMVTPAAAACRVTASPLRATLLSVLFAVVSAVGGIVLSLAPGAPVSAFVTAISFLIYLVCWGISRSRRQLAQ